MENVLSVCGLGGMENGDQGDNMDEEYVHSSTWWWDHAGVEVELDKVTMLDQIWAKKKKKKKSYNSWET